MKVDDTEEEQMIFFIFFNPGPLQYYCSRKR